MSAKTCPGPTDGSWSISPTISKAASSGTAFAAMVKAVRQSYQCLAQGRMDPFLGPGGADKEMKAAQDTCGLERLLQIERRTMKDA